MFEYEVFSMLMFTRYCLRYCKYQCYKLVPMNVRLRKKSERTFKLGGKPLK